jgi:DNA-binding response OmpR family regulator
MTGLMPETEIAQLPNQDRKHILLVDDDIKYCRLISKYLSNHDYEVSLLHSGTGAMEIAIGKAWDLIILDNMLPGVSGCELVRTIRERSDVPILMLSALGDETDRIVGLELGADDYLPKSYSSREILARVRAALRRNQLSRHVRDDSNNIIVGALAITPSLRKVTVDGKTVKLTSIEFDLLISLAQAKGRIKTREQLMNEVRNINYDSGDRSIDVHVSLLRKKLNDDAKNPRLIKTIRSIGYCLQDPEQVDS